MHGFDSPHLPANAIAPSEVTINSDTFEVKITFSINVTIPMTVPPAMLKPSSAKASGKCDPMDCSALMMEESPRASTPRQPTEESQDHPRPRRTRLFPRRTRTPAPHQQNHHRHFSCPTRKSSPPAACAVGEWFLLIGTDSPLDRTYRCLEENAWTRFSLRGSSDFRESAAIDLETNSAHHLRFIGLEVTSIRVPQEPLWRQLTIDPFRGQPGSVFYSLVSQSDKNRYIVWDRCWVHGQSDRSRQWLVFVLDGAHVAVIDSVVDDIFLWSGIEPGSMTNEAGSSPFFIPKGPGPIKIENNYIEAGGISLYVPSDRCCSALAEPTDAIVRRNTFHVGDEWRFGAPSFAGRKIIIRHLLELKQGRRWKIDGNIFDGSLA